MKVVARWNKHEMVRRSETYAVVFLISNIEQIVRRNEGNDG